jgi:hypothetical protein
MSYGASATWALAIALSSFLVGDPRESVWDFQQDAVGAAPEGYFFRRMGEGPPGKWEVLADGENHVLGQLDENPAHHRFALAIVKDLNLEDLELQVRIKPVRGEREQSGGIIWRYRNSKNYMVARLDVIDKNVRLIRISDGNRILLGEAKELELNTGQWYKLRIEHRGREIKLYLDDDVLFIRNDKHFDHPGQIGLWTKCHSVMYFDDFKATNFDSQK